MDGFSIFESDTLNEVPSEVESPCDVQSPIHTWTISGGVIVPSQDAQRDEIPSQLNLECSDDTQDLSPVVPVNVHLSATANLPVSGPDTCKVDPNNIPSDSMIAHAGSQDESQANIENLSPNTQTIGNPGSTTNNDVNEDVIVPDEEHFGYTVIKINLCQYVHENNPYDRLVSEKRCLFEVHN